MLRLVLFSTLLALVLACSNLRIIADDGSVVVGRSLEFSTFPPELDAGNELWTEPRHTQHIMPLLPNCRDSLSFTSDYNVARFQVKLGTSHANTTLGGMNDAGLSASALYFTGFAKFKKPENVKEEDCMNAVPQTKVTTYVLSRYSSVLQLKKDLKKKQFPVVWDQADLGNPTVPVHYAFHDKFGESIVLEYTDRGMNFYKNSLGAMTNAPDYGWHLMNLATYPNMRRTEFESFSYDYAGRVFEHTPSWTGSGFVGMPGDYSSPSRFVKVATAVSHSGHTKDADDAVNKMLHLLQVGDIPRGILQAHIGGGNDEEHAEGEGPVDFTWWTVVYDLGRSCLYYRAYDDMSIKRVCLRNIPDYVAFTNLEGNPEDSYNDVEELMKRGADRDHVNLMHM